jgi:hypothetical protein
VGLFHFYKSAATSGGLGSLDAINLMIFISKNGEKGPKNHKICVCVFFSFIL